MFFGHGGGVIRSEQKSRRSSRQQWRRRIGGCTPTKKRALFMFFSVVSLFAVKGFAQTVTLTGVVQDSSGAVVVGAAIHEQSGTWEASAKSDASGRFSLPNVPA